MKNGRVPETVLKRSVLRQMTTKRTEVICGAGIGENCAIFSFGEQTHTVTASALSFIENVADIAYPIWKAVNSIAAAGGETVGVALTIMLTKEADEQMLKALVGEANQICALIPVELTSVNVAGCEANSKTTVSVFATGSRAAEQSFHLAKTCQVKPGQDIVISKWVGLEGTAKIARAKEQELSRRFPIRFLEQAKAFMKELSVIPEAATAIRSGICAMHNASECGIYGALWELAEGAGVGLEIDLKKIPMKQETIEICEFFEISPYELEAGGCLLMIANNGYDLVRALEKEGIPSAAVGKIMAGKDRVVVNEEERRFLEPPKSDEIHKVL